MKTRMGFVSNSSTSSFVLAGVKIPWHKMVQMQEEAGVPMPDDMYSEDGYEWMESWRMVVGKHFQCDVQGYPEDVQKVGVMVKQAGDEIELSDPIEAISDAIERAEFIRDRLGLEGEVKLYFGEYSSEEY